ncbi:MAG: hypothetical protein V3T08_09340 [Gemmatimonadota bacterium]
MSGWYESMNEAFPPKLSEGAAKLMERVKYRLDSMYGAAEMGEPAFTEDAAHLVAAIVTELGITPEMVEDVKPLLQPSRRRPHATNQSAAASALATLLEVAGDSPGGR